MRSCLIWDFKLKKVKLKYYRYNNILHLFSRNHSVSIKIIQMKSPLKLLFLCSIHQHWQSNNKILLKKTFNFEVIVTSFYLKSNNFWILLSESCENIVRIWAHIAYEYWKLFHFHILRPDWFWKSTCLTGDINFDIMFW